MSYISKLIIEFEKRIYDRQKYKLSLEPIKKELEKLITKLSKIKENLE